MAFPPKYSKKQTRDLIEKWLLRNPRFRYELLTDESGDQYVRDYYYFYWPEVMNTFFDLKVPIAKADLLRLLILYANGGFYADLDVECERSDRITDSNGPTH